METCGSSHYWGRVAEGFGHTVKLLPAQHVKKYRIGQKTDRRDAEAILSARHRKDDRAGARENASSSRRSPRFTGFVRP